VPATHRIPPAALIVVVLLGAMLSCTNRDSVDDRIVGQPWRVTVYYTAVESYHRDGPVTITGCRELRCEHGTDELGRYPGGFATAVREEGTGRITNGPHAGRYLNWSHDVGYWLDDAPRDAHGRALEPFRSAAADGIPRGTRLELRTCGRLDSGDPVPDEVCRKLRTADWEIRDEFTPGLGGANHVDLYVGEESTSDYTTSGDLYVTLTGARLDLRT
jgi:hypothetical protein